MASEVHEADFCFSVFIIYNLKLRLKIDDGDNELIITTCRVALQQFIRHIVNRDKYESMFELIR